jgi:ACR3 family arsenite efflux pump ArsB
LQKAANLWVPVTISFTFLGLTMGWNVTDEAISTVVSRLFHGSTPVSLDWAKFFTVVIELVGLPVLFGLLAREVLRRHEDKQARMSRK